MGYVVSGPYARPFPAIGQNHPAARCVSRHPVPPCAVHVAGELVCGRPPLLRPRGYARTRERIPFPLAQCTTRVTLKRHTPAP